MKKLFYFFTLLLATSLLSCGSDNDDLENLATPNYQISKTELIGTWGLCDSKGNLSNNDYATFNSDGTFEMYFELTPNYKPTGTYTVDGPWITLSNSPYTTIGAISKEKNNVYYVRVVNKDLSFANGYVKKIK